MTTPAFTSPQRWHLWVLLAAALTAADQVIKHFVIATMPLQSSIPVTPWFNWVHVLNTGAAFSFLANEDGWQRYFFSGLGMLVSAGLMYWLWRGLQSRLETAACIALTGGAMGNVVDRIRLGAVVDFLDFHWKDWHWPAFNLADVFVVSGAALFILASRERTPPDQTES